MNITYLFLFLNKSVIVKKSKKQMSYYFKNYCSLYSNRNLFWFNKFNRYKFGYINICYIYNLYKIWFLFIT